MPARPDSAEETVVSVSSDGPYGTKGCHEAMAQRGAQAIIPHSRERQAIEGPAIWCQSP